MDARRCECNSHEVFLSSFVLDRYGRRMSAGRTFKGSSVIVSRLDERQEYWRSAHIAVWRQISRHERFIDERIIQISLRHGAAPFARYRRERYLCLSVTDA